MAAPRLPSSRMGNVRRFGHRVRMWSFWSLAEPLRSYLGTVTGLAFTAAAVELERLSWHLPDLLLFAALVGCGSVSIESTRAVKEIHGALSRDLQTVWYLAIAVILAPGYAFAAPLLLMTYKLWRMPQMIVHRRVFSNATIGLAYGCAS